MVPYEGRALAAAVRPPAGRLAPDRYDGMVARPVRREGGGGAQGGPPLRPNYANLNNSNAEYTILGITRSFNIQHLLATFASDGRVDPELFPRVRAELLEKNMPVTQFDELSGRGLDHGQKLVLVILNTPRRGALYE